jgi:16S rRNA pseudouridine516 synthase
MHVGVRRIDQLLSSLGYCSRKEAQAWCDEGRVTLDGALLDDASRKVDPALVKLDDAPLEFPDGILVMLNKPVGLMCSHDSTEGPRVYDLLPERWQLRDPKVTTIGRLDKDTSGLLLFTDQGQLVQRLTSPKHHVDKVYVATLDREPTEQMTLAFARGLELSEGGERLQTLPAVLRPLGEKRAEVTLREGKYHQVRRMFAAVGAHVLALERIRFGEWELGDLAPGAWRPLQLTGSSSKASSTDVPG